VPTDIATQLRCCGVVSDRDDQPFRTRLAEAIGWCRPRGRADDPRRSLRHDQFQPRPLAANRTDTVHHVLSYRAMHLRRRDGALSPEPADDGRLLVYFPDAELSDGAAEAETDGFYDSFNTPPWDTWVGLFRPAGADLSYGAFVVCWIPPQLVSLAQSGIDVNPEMCIDWLVNGESDHARVAAQWLLRGGPAQSEIMPRAR
jgi:hypothetical protein